MAARMAVEPGGRRRYARAARRSLEAQGGVDVKPAGDPKPDRAHRRGVAALSLSVGLWLALAVGPAAPAMGPAPPGGPDVTALVGAGRFGEAVAAAETLAARRGRAAGAGPLAEAAALDSLARAFFEPGRPDGWDAAERLLERSLAIRERVAGPEDLDVARVLFALATTDDLRGRWTSAEARSARALAIRVARRGPGSALAASSLRQLGMIRFELGRYAAAESLLAGALEAWSALPGDQAARLAAARNDLGEITRAQGRYAEAESHFTAGLALAGGSLAADAPVRVALMNNLAGLYKDLGRYADAEPLLTASLDRRRGADPPDPVAVATATLNLAELYRLQGRADEAEPLYLDALAQARTLYGADHPDLVPFVAQAAVFYRDEGRDREAEPLLREALAAVEHALPGDHPLHAQTLHDLARVRERRLAYAEAESLYRVALGIRERVLGARHPEVALTSVELARCLSADPAAGDAAARPELERALAVLEGGDAYPEARLEAYALRGAMRGRAGDPEGERADLARALDEVDSLRAGRGGGETVRAAFVGRHLALYDRMVELCVDAGDPERAYAAHERARARVLLDQIAAARVDLRRGIPAAERDALERDERRALARLARAQRALETGFPAEPDPAARFERTAAAEAARDSAARDWQRTRAAIEQRSPLWRGLLTASGRPATRAEVQRALAPGETMLLYHAGAARSFVFVIPARGAMRVFELTLDAAAAAALSAPAGAIAAATLERVVAGEPGALARGLRPGVAELLGAASGRGGPSGDPRRAALPARLHGLWRALLPPAVWRQVRAADGVAVVPDGPLHLLPFEALVVSPGPAAPRYWLDDGPPIRVAASATSLAAADGAGGSQDPGPPRGSGSPVTVLSVSDPAFDPESPAASGTGRSSGADATRGTRWARLPGARLETEAIVRAYGAGRVAVLQDTAATEPALRAALAGRRVLHLATHGFVTERRGEVLGGLVLAPGAARAAAEPVTADDGLLQLFEIYELALDCDLAVLSACETGRGPRVAGEGVFALSRGFQVAGARSVAATLWPVDDASTATLIGALFRRLAEDERRGRRPDVARALHEARRELRAGAQADPYYWAPFVLSGAR
jgi:tetratricopeptide (TPR) repeat protein